ncbi:MAG: glycosyltransferase family 87 protein, partial [Planctomycetota bacterium]
MNERYRRGFLVLLILAGLFAAGRALFHKRRISGDFLRYVRSGTLVVRGESHLIYDRDARRSAHVWGDPENLPEMRYKYSPALAVLLSPLGALPLRAAWGLWAFAVAAAVVAGLALTVDLAARRLPDPRLAWIPALAAGPPLIHLYLENVKLGQMNAFAFLGAVAAVWAIDRRRPVLTGWCVAAAVVAKHMPVLLAAWFAWKRQWAAFWWSLG